MTALEECLQRLAAGESVAVCLARYPEHCADLAPMLVAAEQLHVISQARLTRGQRLRAKVVLREELAAQAARRSGSREPRLLGRWARARAVLLAAMVAVALFLSVAFSAVASSRPGDLVYSVRVVVERAPAWLKLDAAGGAAAELSVADRRLSDIQSDEQRHTVALNALVRSDRAAAQRAMALSNAERSEVAERFVTHADELTELAGQAADPATGARLRAAAEQVAGLASQITPLVTVPTKMPASTATKVATRRSTTRPPAVILTATPAPVTLPPPTTLAAEPIPSVRAGTVAASITPRPRPRMSVTPTANPTRTPIALQPGAGTPEGSVRTPRPRPTLAVTPNRRQFTPVVTVPASTVEPPVLPTIVSTVLPTFETPSLVIPTGAPGQASSSTATPLPDIRSAPAVTPPAARPTVPVVPTLTMRRTAFTPVPVGTPRPNIRPNPTAIVTVPPGEAQTAFSGVMATVAPRLPGATGLVPSVTPARFGVDSSALTADIQSTLLPDAILTVQRRFR